MRIALPHNGWMPEAHQLKAWNALRSGAFDTFVLPWHRRCFAEGTPILRPDGSWTPIEQMKAGDKVLLWHEGKHVESEVVKLFDNGLQECVEVDASKHSSMVCTLNHNFVVEGRSEGAPLHEIFEKKLPLLRMPGRNLGALHDIDKARFYGYMLSDGRSVKGRQPKFTNIEFNVITAFSEVVKRLLPTVQLKVRPKGKGFDVGLSNGTRGGGEVVNPVKAFWGESKKKYRRLPPDIWQMDDESLWAFLGAFIDGNGSVAGRDVTSTTLTLCVGESKSTTYDIQHVLTKLKLYNFRMTNNGHNCWLLVTSFADTLARIANNALIAHKGKKDKLEKFIGVNRPEIEGVIPVAIRGIKSVGLRKVYNLNIKEIHRYTANSLVSANCGKDELTLHDAAIRMSQRVGNYWHMLPKADQARKAIWEGINPRTGRVRWQDAFPQGLIKHVDNQQMKLTLINNSTWQVLGSDNYASLLGSTPIHIVMSEAALADPAAFGFFKPILLENGGSSIHISSVRGRNQFYNLFKTHEKVPTSYTELLSALDTGVFTPEQLEKEHQDYVRLYGEALGDSMFRQEYLSDWYAASVGTVFAKELNEVWESGRAKPCPYDSRYPVMTFWDLGVSDLTVILFVQQVGDEKRIIDWYSGSDIGLDHYAKVIQDKPYYYSGHFAPHDIKVREWSTGLSRIQEARNYGINFERVVKLGKDTQIAAASHLLRQVVFNVSIEDEEDKDPMQDAEFILEALGEYKFKFDEKRRVMSKTPEHNWASHYADAFMLMGVALQSNPATKSVAQRTIQGRSFKQIKSVRQIMDRRGRGTRRGSVWGMDR